MVTQYARFLHTLVVFCLVANLLLLLSQPVQGQAPAPPAEPTAAVVIHFDGAAFAPADVTVALGDTIEWWNDTAAAQTLAATGALQAPVGRLYLPLVVAGLPAAEQAAAEGVPAPSAEPILFSQPFAPGERLYLPLVVAELSAAEQAAAEGVPAPSAEPILFSQPFAPGGVVRYTVIGSGVFAYGIVGQPGLGGQVTVVGAATPTFTPTPTPPPTVTPANAPADPSALTDGLVGFWQFDEGSGTQVQDSSGYANTGAFTGSPSWVTGKVGARALSFDGIDDGVSVPSSILLSPHAGSAGEMTVAAWVKAPQLPPTTGQGRTVLVAKGAPGACEYGLYLTASGKVGLNLWRQLGGANYAWVSGGNLTTNAWHHVAGVVKKGQFVRVYLDGALVAQTTTTSGDTAAGSSPLYLARRGDGQYFAGILDDVRLYNRALSAAEVQALATMPTPTPTAAATPTPLPTNTPLPTSTPTASATATPTASATSTSGVTGIAYYVAIDGNDNNPGTIGLPFRTIQKCATVAVAGDTCFIRAGTYRETVTVARSGTQGKPITFTPYAGETVTISGADVITGWTLHTHPSGHVYRANLPWSLNVRTSNPVQITNNQIFVDGQMMPEARWPNIPVANLTRLKNADKAQADSATVVNTFTATYNDAALNVFATNVWAGAKINFGPGYSTTHTTCDVTGSTPGSVSFQCNPDPGAVQQ